MRTTAVSKENVQAEKLIGENRRITYIELAREGAYALRHVTIPKRIKWFSRRLTTCVAIGRAVNFPVQHHLLVQIKMNVDKPPTRPLKCLGGRWRQAGGAISRRFYQLQETMVCGVL
ncbi:hypothetical protein EVAR_8251_1 [Eumeta japonica]|uniref:Uncharacterized protein n=1 Tax=Eumeta variegata TaxID=151549 RepID=A0A4C1TIC9_EUMVA|nr:hypothetical protein EVAR_8251_1 [Eumeta japonica]